MKPHILSLALCLFMSLVVKAQVGCGEDIFRDIQKNAVSNYKELEQQNNLQIKKYIDTHFNTNAGQKPLSTNYVIPVVFHVVYPVGQAYGTGTNISYTQIQSQLAALNAAFSKSYPTYNGQTHPSYAQNTNIQFCLAKIAKPSSVNFFNGPGGIEYGVMRYANSTLTNHQMTPTNANALATLTHPNSTYFPFSDYLNIWIVSSINGTGPSTIIGYAPKPLMGPYPIDGVVMRADAIGDNTTGNAFSLNFGLTQGKILSHEVGHYLNLYHIFEGGCAGANAAGSASNACDLNGDMICDIEPCTTQNISCSQPVPNTCSTTYAVGTTTLDMIENYMSYADDDCMNTFTYNQSQRMWAYLNTSRSNLWQTANLASTGVIAAGSCIAPFLISTINVSGTACKGTPVQIYNPLPGSSATSWTWSAPGGTISSVNTNSTSITFTAVGTFWIKLKISDGTATQADSIQLAVTNCSIVPGKMSQANWYWGKQTSVSFASGVPVPQSPAMIDTFEPGAAVSDNSGNLLFYTDGSRVWNKNHVQMTNLGGWLFGFNYWQVSACQGALIVPMPMSTTKYYIFSGTQEPGNNPGDTTMQLRYSIIDMTLNGGLGEISVINQVVPGPYMLTTEGTCAIPHCNGYDYWVISKGAKTTGYKDKVAAYLVTAGGVQPPVISNAMFSVPSTTGTGTDPNEFIVCIEASPDGKTVAITENTDAGGIPVNTYVRFYAFDNRTGTLTNVKNMLFPSSAYLGGQQFSPDSKKLYISCGNDVNQIDITNINSPVVTSIFNNNNNKFRFQLGPDDKVYAITPVIYTTQMSVINFPNLSGSAASFSLNTVSLFSTNDVRIGLPNFIDAKQGPVIAPSFAKSAINCNTMQFSVDSCWLSYSASWNFGDGNTGSGAAVTHSYTGSGTFSVSLVLSVPGYTFPAVSQNVTILPAVGAISGPSAICKGTPFLNVYGVSNIPGASYIWTANNGSISGPSNLNNVNVTAGGTGVLTLSVQVVNGGCTSVASKTVAIDTIPVITFSPMMVCNGSTLALSANPTGGTFSGTGVTGNVFNSAVTGIGTQTVNYVYTNSNGCSASKSGTLAVNNCTGINETGASSGLKIYPNPNNGEFIVSGVSLAENGVVEIYNCLGQKIESKVINTSAAINLSQHSNGIYFVKVRDSRGIIATARIIKQ